MYSACCRLADEPHPMPCRQSCCHHHRGAQTGQNTPIDLIVDENFHRAAPGGMGGTKAVGNYSPVLMSQTAAKKEGYADVVYLDARTDTFLEEVSSCNIFVVKGRSLRTPALTVRAPHAAPASGVLLQQHSPLSLLHQSCTCNMCDRLGSRSLSLDCSHS